MAELSESLALPFGMSRTSLGPLPSPQSHRFTSLPLHHRLCLGTCAWSFEEWRGRFYPRNLPPSHWLEFYSQFFGAVEVDTTFYQSPAKHVLEHWFKQTPEDFQFAVRMPRQFTHRLRGDPAELRAFLNALEALGSKLACVLVQLPPSLSPVRDELALRRFIRNLPSDIRFAVEFRHLDWHLPRIVHLLERRQICWVWNDTAPLSHQGSAAFAFLPQTTDFLYVRLLGDLGTEFCTGEKRQDGQLMTPRDLSLENWRVKLARHMEVKVFVFVSNHFEGMAPMSCQRFASVCGIPLKMPEPEPVLQMSLVLDEVR